MATATYNPLKGKPVADSGDYKTEIPSAETHDARIIALVDLGTHNESFKGEAEKPRHSLYVVFELDEEMTGMKGVNHVVAVKFTLSFHEKAGLRKLAESLINDGQRFGGDGEIDYMALLGQPCTVQISHTKKIVDGKGERVYVNVGTISAVAKKKRETFFKAKRAGLAWFIGQDLDELPDYLPRIYGEKVIDVISRSHEMTGRKSQQDEAEGEVGAASGSDEETPF